MNYDPVSIAFGCLFIIIAFFMLAMLLASHSWKQADQMLHETFNEIKWDSSALMKHCPECQREREQVL